MSVDPNQGISPNKQFKMYRELVVRSGAGALIQAEIKRQHGVGGRPRDMDVETFIALGMLTASRKKTSMLTKLREQMLELSTTTQIKYKIREAGPRGKALTQKQFYDLNNSITRALDHMPARTPHLSDAERERRADVCAKAFDLLINAAGMHLPTATRYAIDATPVESAARGKAKNKRLERDDAKNAARRQYSADMDARWGKRTRTYNKNYGFVFGYQMMAFTRVNEVGSREMPALIEHFRMVPANANGIEETLEVLSDLNAGDSPVVEILSDRGFTRYNPEDWAQPLADMGIAQVVDLQKRDHGARPNPTDGYIMVDGWPHSPSMPQHLIDIKRPKVFTPDPLSKHADSKDLAKRRKQLKTIERFRKGIAARSAYRFERVGRTSSGNPRFQAPARAGKMRCRGYEPSLELEDDLPTCEHPPGTELPKACRQATITIDASITLKFDQQHPWGTDQWLASNNRRGNVERTFGHLKGPSGAKLDRGWTLLTGHVRTSFWLAIQVAAQNVRTMLTWVETTGFTDDPILLQDLTNYGSEEYDEHGNLPGRDELDPDGRRDVDPPPTLPAAA